jgi:hypothetical protein
MQRLRGLINTFGAFCKINLRKGNVIMNKASDQDECLLPYSGALCADFNIDSKCGSSYDQKGKNKNKD